MKKKLRKLFMSNPEFREMVALSEFDTEAAITQVIGNSGSSSTGRNHHNECVCFSIRIVVPI